MDRTAPELGPLDPTFPQYKPNVWDICNLCQGNHIKNALTVRSPKRAARPPHPTQVIDNLYISGIYTAAKHVTGSLYSTRAPRITHVLSIIDGRCYDKELLQEHISGSPLPRVVRKEVFLYDNNKANIIDHFPEMCRFIHEALSEPAADDGHTNKVLVHCFAGRSRSATAIIAYLMWAQRMSMREARAHVRSARSCICPNDGFVAQLKLWERLDCNLLNPPLPRHYAVELMDGHFTAINQMCVTAGLPAREPPEGAESWHSDEWWDSNEERVSLAKLEFQAERFRLGWKPCELPAEPYLMALTDIMRSRKPEKDVTSQTPAKLEVLDGERFQARVKD